MGDETGCLDVQLACVKDHSLLGTEERRRGRGRPRGVSSMEVVNII